MDGRLMYVAGPGTLRIPYYPPFGMGESLPDLMEARYEVCAGVNFAFYRWDQISQAESFRMLLEKYGAITSLPHAEV